MPFFVFGSVCFAFLQEVIRDMATDVWFATTGCRVELEECVLQVLINLHDRSLVSTTVAVVGCTEDGHHIPVLAPIVALS